MESTSGNSTSKKIVFSPIPDTLVGKRKAIFETSKPSVPPIQGIGSDTQSLKNVTVVRDEGKESDGKKAIVRSPRNLFSGNSEGEKKSFISKTPPSSPRKQSESKPIKDESKKTRKEEGKRASQKKTEEPWTPLTARRSSDADKDKGVVEQITNHKMTRAPSIPLFQSQHHQYKSYIFKCMNDEDFTDQEPLVEKISKLKVYSKEEGAPQELYLNLNQWGEMLEFMIVRLKFCVDRTKEYKADSPRYAENFSTLSTEFISGLVYLDKISKDQPHHPDLISFINGYREYAKNKDVRNLFLDFMSGEKNDKGKKALQSYLESLCEKSSFDLLKKYYPKPLVKAYICSKKNHWKDEAGRIQDMLGTARSYLADNNSPLFYKIRINHKLMNLGNLNDSHQESIVTLIARMLQLFYQYSGRETKEEFSTLAKKVINNEKTPFADFIHWNSNGGKLILLEFMETETYPAFFMPTRLYTINLKDICEEFKEIITTYTRKNKVLSEKGLTCSFQIGKEGKKSSATIYSLWCLCPLSKPDDKLNKQIIKDLPLVYFYIKWKGFPDEEKRECSGYSQIMNFWITENATPEQEEMILKTLFEGGIYGGY